MLNKQPKITTGLIEGGEKIWTATGQIPYLKYYTEVLVNSLDKSFGEPNNVYLAA